MDERSLERATPLRAPVIVNVENPSSLAGFFISAASADNLERRRAVWLARRYRLSLSLAEAVSSLHFGEARQ